jgi:hypothetical protein
MYMYITHLGWGRDEHRTLSCISDIWIGQKIIMLPVTRALKRWLPMFNQELKLSEKRKLTASRRRWSRTLGPVADRLEGGYWDNYIIKVGAIG